MFTNKPDTPFFNKCIGTRLNVFMFTNKPDTPFFNKCIGTRILNVFMFTNKPDTPLSTNVLAHVRTCLCLPINLTYQLIGTLVRVDQSTFNHWWVIVDGETEVTLIGTLVRVDQYPCNHWWVIIEKR